MTPDGPSAPSTVAEPSRGATPATAERAVEPATPASAATTRGDVEQVTTSTAEVATVASEDDGSSVGAPLMMLLLGLVLLAAVGGYVIGARRRTGDPSPAASRQSPQLAPGSSSAAEVSSQAVSEELVQGLIDARDRIGPGATSDRIGAVLARAGIETIDPTGRSFDAGSHTAQAPPTLTADPALDGTVAAVVTLGYAEAGVVRRLPVVVVHRFDGDARTIASAEVPEGS